MHTLQLMLLPNLQQHVTKSVFDVIALLALKTSTERVPLNRSCDNIKAMLPVPSFMSPMFFMKSHTQYMIWRMNEERHHSPRHTSTQV